MRGCQVLAKNKGERSSSLRSMFDPVKRHSSFALTRENALRKRRTRAARTAFACRRLSACFAAWRRSAVDGREWHGVLQRIGDDMRRGLMVQVFEGWHDRVQFKTWKAGSMMRWVGWASSGKEDWGGVWQ